MAAETGPGLPRRSGDRPLPGTNLLGAGALGFDTLIEKIRVLEAEANALAQPPEHEAPANEAPANEVPENEAPENGATEYEAPSL